MNVQFKEVQRSASRSMASPVDNVTFLTRLLARKNEALLEHPYFQQCRTTQITREQMLGIIKQLYCFSVFFERLLARRIAEYSSTKDPRIIQTARQHMREEIGHAQLFRECLESNGVAVAEIEALAPGMFTKAMFGYLSVTIQHENEYVSNVAIMQVMESIGYHFFGATLTVMQAHGMLADAMIQHSEDDEEHAKLGLELASEFDPQTMLDCRRIIDDIYGLMPLVLTEWMEQAQNASSPAHGRRRSNRTSRSTAPKSGSNTRSRAAASKAL